MPKPESPPLTTASLDFLKVTDGQATRSQIESTRKLLENRESELWTWLRNVEKFAQSRFGLRNLLSPDLATAYLDEPPQNILRAVYDYLGQCRRSGKLAKADVDEVMASAIPNGFAHVRQETIQDYLDAARKILLTLLAMHPELAHGLEPKENSRQL